MNRLISCEFNMDTTCVELKFADGSVIAIDTIAVENEVADNMYQRSELDCLRFLLEKQFAQPPFQVDTDAPERRNSCSSDKGEPWDE